MADLNKRTATGMTPTDPAVKRIAITGSAQSFDPSGRGLKVTTAGTITGKLIEEDEDVEEEFEVGVYPYAFKSITSATAAGFVLL